MAPSEINYKFRARAAHEIPRDEKKSWLISANRWGESSPTMVLYYLSRLDTHLEKRRTIRMRSPRGQGPGRPGVTAWAQVAELVRQEMRSSPNASLTEVFRSVYVPTRWVDSRIPEPKERTIRGWITALENIERIEDDTDDEYVGYVRRLRSAPVAAVQLIARWNRYDHYKSLKAARVIVGGRWSVDQLRKAEENARKESKVALYGRQYAHRLGIQVRDWADLHLNPDFKRIKVRPSDDPADFVFEGSSKPDARAAVLIFGPYTNWKEYQSRFGSFMGVVAGLASYCERVLAIVPDHGGRYWRWLLQRKLQGAGIEFYAVHYHVKDFVPVKIGCPAPDELVSQEQ